MKKVIRRWGAQLVFTDDGIALRRGISGRQCKFLRWEEVAAAGYFVGSGTHVAYDADAASLYPHMQLVARENNAPSCSCISPSRSLRASAATPSCRCCATGVTSFSTWAAATSARLKI